MHVGLNLVYLVPGETGGTETYARQLIPELLDAAPSIRLTAFVNREAAAAVDGPWDQLVESVTVPVNARSRLQWVRGEQHFLPRLAGRLGVDIVHSLANTAPAWGPFRRVVTIHDLHYRLVPEAHLGVRGAGMGVLVPLAARRAHRVIVPSHTTARDVSCLLRLPAAKTDVVPQGVGRPASGQALTEDEVRRFLNAGVRPIVLCVCAKRPHKNLERLICAMARIRAADRPLLVLPGYPTPYEEVLRRRVAELSLSAQVRLLGWVEEPLLEGLYAAAACFVFPSLYEGFGLPVLEAMARGVPVACSGRGALDEVAGNAALRFDPESEPAIAAAIERLLSDGQLRAQLHEAGLKRASNFTWAATATGTLRAYERALSASP
jgi:glycosyltransferase involved in cell wall biosynthesis